MTSTRQNQYDALYHLWETYLHMRAWGSPDYESIREEAREQFVELVQTGALFTYVEDCKRDVLRAGVDAPDHWLSVLCAARLVQAEQLPESDRDRLGQILDQMYPMLVRLDPDAMHRAEMNDCRQTDDDDEKQAQTGSTTETPHPDDELTESDIVESTQYGGPIEDEYDDRFAKWMGKRLYLGRDTQISRLFWLLARPLGRARGMDEVQIAVDGMITDDSIDSPPEEIRKAALRVRKAVSKLRGRMRDDGFDDHLVIHRDGGNECPEYTMVRRF